MKIVDGDLFTAPVDVIAHQCNTKSANVHGFAKFAFQKHPEAHTKEYFDNHQSPMLGDIDCFPVNNCSYKALVNMYSQRYPGPPNPVNKDSKEFRLKWFRSCLDKIAIMKIDSVGFPYMIGCALGGGKWEDYLKELELFEAKFKRPVYLYRLQP